MKTNEPHDAPAPLSVVEVVRAPLHGPSGVTFSLFAIRTPSATLRCMSEYARVSGSWTDFWMWNLLKLPAPNYRIEACQPQSVPSPHVATDRNVPVGTRVHNYSIRLHGEDYSPPPPPPPLRSGEEGCLGLGLRLTCIRYHSSITFLGNQVCATNEMTNS